MTRNIENILNFRGDLSPFLVHLTKDVNGTTPKPAKEVLEKIINDKKLIQSGNLFSPLSYGTNRRKWKKKEEENLFSAVCFTETPIHEIHCLFEIENRGINLSTYGLVFLKNKLTRQNVSPVLYLNNFDDKIEGMLYKLGEIIEQENYSEEFYKLFPLFSLTGKYILKKGNTVTKKSGEIDFSWEREWRYPYCYGNFDINPKDIFVGLCDYNEIKHFESLAQEIFHEEIPFIDPRVNAKYYADKLIKRQEALELPELLYKVF